jgi:hypothetical protein
VIVAVRIEAPVFASHASGIAVQPLFTMKL